MKTKRRVLFVDDLSERWEIFNELYRVSETAHVEFVWAKNYDEAITQLQNGNWDVVFLDHDLEEAHYHDQQQGWRDGTAIADWVREHTPQVNHFVCHSMNPVGRSRMAQIVGRGGYTATTIPFYTFDYSMVSLIADGDGSQILTPDPVWDKDETRDMYGG